MADIIAQNFPNKVLIPVGKNIWPPTAWCIETFENNDNWICSAGEFRFRHEKDAILFMLRWQ